MSGKETLDQLCEYILTSFEFIHEHLYEFCMDNRMYSDFSYQYYPMDGGPSTNISMDRIGLVQDQVFSLHYDYGDDWMLAIQVLKIEDDKEKQPPKLLKSVGHIKQY